MTPRDRPWNATGNPDRLTHTLRISSATFLTSLLIHEISQPLSTLNALSAACLSQGRQEDSISSHLRARLEQMVAEAERATFLVREFRQSIAQVAGAVQDIDLSLLLADTLKLVKEEAVTAGITMLFRPKGEEFLISADPARIEMAIYLLIRNSMDALEIFGGQRKEISVSLKKGSGGAVMVLIEDSGPGLGVDVISDLFKPFVSTKLGGIGLGLALSRWAVRSQGGEISLVSSSGEGTTFSIELPPASLRQIAEVGPEA